MMRARRKMFDSGQTLIYCVRSAQFKRVCEWHFRVIAAFCHQVLICRWYRIPLCEKVLNDNRDRWCSSSRARDFGR
jgi:hypothetical protein